MTDIQQRLNDNPANSPHNSTPTVRLEPISENIVVPAPWYKRIFSPVTRTETVWRLTFLFLIVIGILVGRSMSQPQQTVTKAGVGTARITFYPPQIRVPPEKSFQLWLTTENPISSAVITVTFDSSLLQLSQEITTKIPPGYSMTTTPRVSANQTGAIEFRFLSKEKAQSLPGGTTQFATMFFTSKKKGPLPSSNVSIDQQKTTILDQGSIPFTLITKNATVEVSK